MSVIRVEQQLLLLALHRHGARPQQCLHNGVVLTEPPVMDAGPNDDELPSSPEDDLPLLVPPEHRRWSAASSDTWLLAKQRLL